MSTTPTPSTLVCDWDGCTRTLPYAGTGRPPKYCQQPTDADRAPGPTNPVHNKANAKRVREGLMHPNGQDAPGLAERVTALENQLAAERAERDRQMAELRETIAALRARLSPDTDQDQETSL